MKPFLGALAIASLLAGPAVAADMPVKAPIVAPVALYNWSGFYTASTLGIGWTREYGDFVLPPPDRHNSRATRAWYDSHIGFQWQFDRWVLGVEGTYATPISNDWASSTSPSGDCFGATPIPDRFCESRISRVWGAGGKLGYTWDKLMLYGEGGWASARIETRDRIASTGLINVAENVTYRHNGWYAGTGIDYFLGKFWLSDVILGAEYRHYQFNTVRHFPVNVAVAPPVQFAADVRDVRGNLDLVSVRLTFKWTPVAAVIAKY